jgi:hypothetical protein
VDDNSKKYFDVSWPNKPIVKPQNRTIVGNLPQDQTKSEDVSLKTIDPTKPYSEEKTSSADPEINNQIKINEPASDKGKEVKPLEMLPPNTAPDAPQTKEVSEAVNIPNAPNTPAPNTPAPAPQNPINTIPDPGEKMAQQMRANMQEPKIYDTKEFYVPIGNSHHKHGDARTAFLFGIVCACVLVGAVLYYVFVINRG